MLGEATTTKFTKDRDSQSFPNLKKDAQDGGMVAGRTRKDIERQSNKKIISRKNYLRTSESQKRLIGKKAISPLKPKKPYYSTRKISMLKTARSQ